MLRMLRRALLGLVSVVTVLLLVATPAIAQFPLPPINVTVLLPLPTTFQGVNGSGYIIDIQLTAFNSSFNSLLSAANGYFPTFNGGLNKSIDRVGFQTGVPGLVCLFSTTPTSINPAGNLTNLAGIFNIDAVATLPSGATQITSIWLVGGAFAHNESATMTVFVLNTTAPTVLPADFANMPGILSPIVVTPFHVTGSVSPTADTSIFVPGQPANSGALEVVVFTPVPGETVGLNGFNFVIDLLAIATDVQFNPLLSVAAGYVPLNANGTDPAITRPGPSVAAPGVVVLLNTTTLGTGANTNLAGLFQLNGIFSDSSNPTGQLLNGIWFDWQAGKPSFGSGPSQLIVFILNTTAPSSIIGAPEEQVGLISNIVRVDFFISPPTAAVLGDPWFTGFHGQSAYQVHGIPGGVFNLLTAADLQFNALFSFIDHGEAMTAAQMKLARLITSAPVTQPWSHPGTYLGKLGLKLGTIQLLIHSGSYKTGIANITVIVDGQTQTTLSVGHSVGDNSGSVERLDAWRLRVVHPLVSLVFVNSDRFFNIEEATLRSHHAFLSLDGLLGQSSNPDWKAEKGRQFEQHMLFDYLVMAEGDKQADDYTLLSNSFDNNKFETTESTKQ